MSESEIMAKSNVSLEGADSVYSVALSVIVPTHNRQGILAKCLEALERQTLPREEFEIIVVDDGSTDSTLKIVEEHQDRSEGPFVCLNQERGGPAIARNRALRHVRGEFVLIINDDTIATPTLLAKHLEMHRQNTGNGGRICVLGEIQWSPELDITDFMKDVEDLQFALSGLEHEEELDYRYFVTSNISLRREFFNETGGFDESFPYPAFEDIELGYRLQKSGWKILYNRKALAYHHHPLTLEDFIRRCLFAGYSKRLFSLKHPEIGDGKYWRRSRQFRYWFKTYCQLPLLKRPQTLHVLEKMGIRIDRKKWHQTVLKYYFEKGYRSHLGPERIRLQMAKLGRRVQGD